jgi:hypothetical protein
MENDQGNVRLGILSNPPPGYPMTAALDEDLSVRNSLRLLASPPGILASTKPEDVHPGEVERRSRGYYEAYYSELHGRVSQYPAKADIFPDVLLGPRHVVAELGSDGVVATHWPAQQQGFEFHLSLHREAQDIAGDHRLSVPSGRSATLIGYGSGFDFGAWTFWRSELHEGSVVVKTGWARMDILSLDSIDSVLSETQARGHAEADVRIAADAYLMGLQQAPPGTTQRDQVLAQLEFAINEFEKVLEVHANDEKMIQLYLNVKRNQILLDPSALSIKPQVTLAAKYVPDFVIEVAEEKYVLVEIERPALPLLTEKGRPRAELTHAQQQVEDWFEWISRHSEYARELLPGISEPHGWVVMGRRSSIAPQHKNVLARANAESRRITTMTYDDLLDRAKQHLENLRGL